MFYFNTREKAQAFARKTGYQFVDNGKESQLNRRWAVRVVVVESAAAA